MGYCMQYTFAEKMALLLQTGIYQ